MQELQETWVWSLGRVDPLEEGMATHSSILAWRIQWAEEPGGLQSIGSQSVGHGWSDLARTVESSLPRGEFPGGLVVRGPLSLPRAGVHAPASQARGTSLGHVRWKQLTHNRTGIVSLDSGVAVQLSLTAGTQEKFRLGSRAVTGHRCQCLLERPFWLQTLKTLSWSVLSGFKLRPRLYWSCKFHHADSYLFGWWFSCNFSKSAANIFNPLPSSICSF